MIVWVRGAGQGLIYFKKISLFFPTDVEISRQTIVVNADSQVKRSSCLAVNSSMFLNRGEGEHRGVS